jgi:hypothetical protein
MATYKGIKGFKVTSIAGDPTNKIEGDVYYDTTANTLKYVEGAGGTWATDTAVAFGRHSPGGTGTASAAIIFGGEYGPPWTSTGKTEEWNGSSWAEQNDMSHLRYSVCSIGRTTTDSICAAGYKSAVGFESGWTELYNGTAWSGLANVNTKRYSLAGGAGTSSAGLMAGGDTCTCEEFNGTSWGTVNNLNNLCGGSTTTGASTSAARQTGGSPSATNGDQSEDYNGTSWSVSTSLNVGRGSAAGAAGTENATLYWGGCASPGEGGCDVAYYTEKWNGTAWTELGDLPNKKQTAGTSTASATTALSATGWGPGYNSTQHFQWTYADSWVKTVSTS